MLPFRPSTPLLPGEGKGKNDIRSFAIGVTALFFVSSLVSLV
jgi:hypothetical protein